MNWLGSNWIWILLIGGMLWMHLGMHRGHGGHGGHGGHAKNTPQSLPGHEGHSQHDSAGETAAAGTGSSRRHRGC